VRCRKSIRVIPARRLQEGVSVPAELVDCGCHGVSVMLDRPMEVGEQFVIKLQLDRLRMLIYAVRHCQPMGSQYHIGAEFTGLFAVPAAVEPSAILNALLSMEG
jgi:hypothetical protein